jgi:hypothetical protein
VLLDRRTGAKASLTPADSPTVVRCVLREAYALGRKLTPAGFDAVAGAVDHAECYCLTYSGLEDAVELLQRRCA